MSVELPKGWASARLEEIVTKKKGKKPAVLRDTPAEGFVPYLDIHAIEKNVVREYAEAKSSKIATKDDLFVAWDGARSGWVGGGITGAIGSTIMALTAQTVQSAYVRQFIASQFKNLNTNTRGTGIPHVDPEVFWNLEVPLAPLAEQRRIVAKLGKLLGQVDACQQRLEKLPTLLKRFRQSVLAAACSGRLTADWRNENANISAADSLIKDAQFQIAQSEDELPELPEKWKWVALGNYARCFRGRFSPRPRNDPRYFGGKHPFIQIGNLPREGGLVSSHVQTLNDKGLAVSRKFPKGTVVIAIVGATIGNTGVLAYDMCVTDSIVGLETGDEIGNRYVELFLRHKKDDIRQISYSSGGQPNINLAVLNPYPLALPPLAEQQEIVRRVEGLFALAEQLEQRLSQARRQVDKLAPSLLARAFAGKLVPQNPADEPAQELLERIRQDPKLEPA
jgi:type I restriction enzyme, S subunit